MTFQDYPNRISMSIYPINTMIRLVTLLFKRNQWTNFASISDSNSVINEPFHQALRDGMAVAFLRNNSKVRYNVFYCNASQDVTGTFLAASENSRSKCLKYLCFCQLFLYHIGTSIICRSHVYFREWNWGAIFHGKRQT